MMDDLDLKERANSAQPIALPKPLPLLADFPLPAPFPIDALERSKLGEIVKAVQGEMQAPMALPAQSALAAAALAVQGFADVETLGGQRPLSLYFLTIAESGERKSSCDKRLMQPISEYEKEQSKANVEARQDWTKANIVYQERLAGIKTKIKTAKGEATGDADLQRLGLPPAEPPSTDRLVTEPTFEGLTKLYAIGQPSLGLFSDEGGQFLGGHAMSKDNAMKTMGAFNSLWMAEAIKRTRGGDGSMTLYGRRLSLHLMVQPLIGRNLLADPLADGSGFLARCLICEPDSAIGKRFHGTAKIAPPWVIGAYTERMAAILRTPMPVDPVTGALEARLLKLSREAREMLIAYSDEIELAQGEGHCFQPIRSYASKSAEQACRLAGVLTLWHDLRAGEVSGGFMQDGIDLARYYLNEAARLANVSSVSQDLQDAEKLRGWLLERSGKLEITNRELKQGAPGTTLRRDNSRRMAAIACLIDHGWLVSIDPDKRWQIVRG